jgi:hypothetical protein
MCAVLFGRLAKVEIVTLRELFLLALHQGRDALNLWIGNGDDCEEE